MPERLIERAQALVRGDLGEPGGWVPVPLRDAATVVMVSDAQDGLHVYLQRRVRTMAFAAGMYVFPGGAVDAKDRTNALNLIKRTSGPLARADLEATDDQAAGLGEDTLSARFAAVREVAEEANHDLLDPMMLRYIAHWVTPEVEDRRYDTRFYAVVLPAENAVHESSLESDHERWLRPAEALAAFRADQMAMLPPTVAVLSRFAAAAESGEDAFHTIERLAALPIVPILPAPIADPSREDGIRWALTDVRSGTELIL